MFEEYLAGIAGGLAELRMHDLAPLALAGPFAELLGIISIRDRHVLIARIRADRAEPLIGPVEAAGLHPMALRSRMHFEQRHPAHLRRSSKAL